MPLNRDEVLKRLEGLLEEAGPPKEADTDVLYATSVISILISAITAREEQSMHLAIQPYAQWLQKTLNARIIQQTAKNN